MSNIIEEKGQLSFDDLNGKNYVLKIIFDKLVIFI